MNKKMTDLALAGWCKEEVWLSDAINWSMIPGIRMLPRTPLGTKDRREIFFII